MARIVFLSLIALVWFISCRKEDTPPTPVVPGDVYTETVAKYLKIDRIAPSYKVQLPTYITGFYPAAQPNAALAQLGRVLFYDKKLSKDGTISCASCHEQAHGFADPNALSTGVSGFMTTRNSMALGNIQWMGGMLGLDSVGNALLPLFWDSRAHSVTEQSRAAFTNAHEMGLTMPEVRSLVQQQPYYPWLFAQATGDTTVTEDRIFTALTHFMSAMSSNHSKLDEGLALLGNQPNINADFSNFSATENAGKQIYINSCVSCHGSINSIQKVFEANNGLDKTYGDKGKGAISGKFYENGTFKVPGLRNIELTAPYMHDGRFKTLYEVVEHYNSGVIQGFGLHGDLLTYDPVTQNYSPRVLNLTEAEKQALIAFLKTMTDQNFITDVRFSDPFR
jgi:cytochrome c peroxidase